MMDNYGCQGCGVQQVTPSLTSSSPGGSSTSSYASASSIPPPAPVVSSSVSPSPSAVGGRDTSCLYPHLYNIHPSLLTQLGTKNPQIGGHPPDQSHQPSTGGNHKHPLSLQMPLGATHQTHATAPLLLPTVTTRGILSAPPQAVTFPTIAPGMDSSQIVTEFHGANNTFSAVPGSQNLPATSMLIPKSSSTPPPPLLPGCHPSAVATSLCNQATAMGTSGHSSTATQTSPKIRRLYSPGEAPWCPNPTVPRFQPPTPSTPPESISPSLPPQPPKTMAIPNGTSTTNGSLGLRCPQPSPPVSSHSLAQNTQMRHSTTQTGNRVG
ncbi:hypothetical protein J437_LFUL013175, partial [Ladona fulva]